MERPAAQYQRSSKRLRKLPAHAPAHEQFIADARRAYGSPRDHPDIVTKVTVKGMAIDDDRHARNM